MSWINWLCIALVIAGIGLFLYGANVYNATVGWAGFYMGITGILLYIGSYIYFEIKKETVKEPVQNP
jgi:membrane-bound ClpP family serine protease